MTEFEVCNSCLDKMCRRSISLEKVSLTIEYGSRMLTEVNRYMYQLDDLVVVTAERNDEGKNYVVTAYRKDV